MKKAIYWLTMNAGFAAALWFGFWQGVDGAQYVAKFFVWAWCLPMGLIALFSEDFQKRMAKEPKESARHFVGRVIAWAALGTFVWTGHIFTAVAWGVWMFCAAAVRMAVEKLRQAPAAA